VKNFFSRLIERQKQSVNAKGSKFTKMPPARLAIYDSMTTLPKIIELTADDFENFVNTLATTTYQSVKEAGGNIPFTVIKEIIENLIHAYFKEVVISVYDGGNIVRISDQGPGIKDKERAVQPGFSTATQEMKRFIKGVGSGLSIAKESLNYMGGKIQIEDNLQTGTVVTLYAPKPKQPPSEKKESVATVTEPRQIDIKLNKRQKQVLCLVTEFGSIGPSKIATELGVSLSTAYRDLLYLEHQGLVSTDNQGKRSLTSRGLEYLDLIIKS
jgi:anti-sigma regulatory factor (Ser/Thr protein kinase)/predicted transcriptional regulator